MHVFTEVLIVDISAAAGRLKRAAIDAAMKQRDYSARGDTYVFDWNGVPGAVTRPGADGLGGGIVLSVPSEHPRAGAPENVIEQAKQSLTETLAAEFEMIRSYIDSALRPWATCPQPAAIRGAGEECDALVSGLMGAVSQSGSVVSGAGELGAHLGRMNLESTSFGGGAFDTFKTRYIDASPLRAVRLTAIAEVIGQAIAAEAEIWDRVKVDLPELLGKYAIQFARLAEGDSARASVAFSVVGAALAGAGLLATGGTAIALAGAGIVVSLADSLTGSKAENDKRAFADVTGGLEAFSAALQKLSQRIYGEETQIIDGVSAAIERVRGNSDKFQLAPAGISAANADGTMYAEPERNLSLARTFMPNAAQAVAAVIGKPDTVDSVLKQALERDYAVGHRLHGAWNSIADLGNLLEALLKEFAWDLDQGARSLELAILDWSDAEEQNENAAKALAAEIESGVTHDGRPAEDLLDIPGTRIEVPWFGDLSGMMNRGAGPGSGNS